MPRVLLILLACGALAATACFPASRVFAVEVPPGYGRIWSGRGEVRGAVVPPRAAQTPAGSPRGIDPSASDKKVAISSGTQGFVYAGQSSGGDAARNAITMNGGTASGLGGGMTTSGNAVDNVIILNGGHVENEVRGGRSTLGDAAGNSVTVGNGVKVGNSGSTGFVFGGDTDDGVARGNSVALSGIVDQEVYGGYSLKGAAGQNSVTMDAGSTLVVTGGYCAQGNADGNSVILSGGTVLLSIMGGQSDTARAGGNSVAISGGVTASVDGGIGVTAVNNRVVVSGGQVQGMLTGGNALTGAANGNSVEITGGSVGSAAIPGSGAFGGVANNDTASLNTVIISNGTVTGNLIGGSSASGRAEKNSVYLGGGTVTGTVAGGGTNVGSAVNNSVTISGRPDLSGAAVYGGLATGAAVDAHSGNTLFVREFRGNLKTVGHFENYDFFLPADTADGSVILNLSDSTDISGGAAATKARISGMAEGGRRLSAGDTIHLLQSASALTANNMDLAGGSFRQGIAFTYEYDLSVTANALDATILGSSQSSEAEGPSDGSIAGGDLINGGADLIAGPGMDNALAAARAAQRPQDNADPWGVGFFGTVSDSRLRYNVDSAVRMNNVNLVVGAVKLWGGPQSEILAGAFFDAGFGAYRSSRDSGGLSFSASGNTAYRGGGLLFRYGRVKGALAGAYVEATARAGSLNVRYRSEDLTQLASRDVSYDVSMPYYGGHGGLGYVWKLGEKSALDIYGKFFWTHVGGCSAVIAGDPFEFQSLDSQRLRGGLRYSLGAGERLSAYLGAAYERELGGRVRSSVYDSPVPSTSLAGDTGIGELGLALRPAPDGNFSMELGMQGFIGKREGVAGNLRMQYAF